MPLDSARAAWPAAKFGPPGSRAVVSRSRLFGPLDSATVAGGVALVVAPGGTGKTTLVADWARQTPVPVAWYAVDPVDRDSRHLTMGLCLAIDRVMPGAADRALAALSGGAQDAAALGLLLGEIEGRPLALALDDFHHLDEQHDVTALWDHVLRFRPSTLAIIVMSRSVPLLSFSTLAAFDQLTGVGREEMAFDDVETADLLAAHGLDARHAAVFASRSGGWAAGVLLLARAAPTGMRFLRARTEALMEHLGGEILTGLPIALRTFLLESAVLGAVTPDDADAILGRSDSAALYADVAAYGLFLDYDGGLYRYHDLFADYLIGELRATNPDRLRAIRRAASAWWSAHDDLPRALGLLAAGEDWEALVETLDHERSTLWTQGLGGTILLHMDRLPAAYHTPRLLAQCGYARSQRGEHAQALELADAGMAAARDDDEWLSPALLRVQALVYAGRDEDALRSADAALAVAQSAANARAVMFLWELRGTASLRLGRLDEGQADLMAALTVYEKGGDEDGQARVLYNLATQLIGVGYAQRADDYLTRSGVLYRRLANPSVVGDLHTSRARLHLLEGNLIAARQEAEQARAVAQRGGYPLQECEALVILAEIDVDAGNAREAQQYAEEAGAMAARLDLPEMLNDSRRARIGVALLRRDRAEARQLIDEAQILVDTPVEKALLDLLDGTRAIRARAYRRAAEILGPAGEQLERLHRPHQAARAYLLCGEALLASGSVRRCEDMLNRMAVVSLPIGAEGYLRPVARLARQVTAKRRFLRHVRRGTRLLLDHVTETIPMLSLVPFGEGGLVSPLLRLSPFGMGRIELAGHNIDLSALPLKARELLFFAGQAGAPLTRDALLDTLWDGDVKAAPSLWNATRHVRRVLGDDSWGPRDGVYGIHIPLQDDGRRFDEVAAVALGQGELTDRVAAASAALDLVGAGGYLEWCDSPWVMGERNRVGRRIMMVALVSARCYEQMGRRDDMFSAWRRAIAFDPLDEAPRLALVQCLIADGQDGMARNEYKAYRRLLHEKMELEPSDELRALVLTTTGRHLC